MNPKGGSPLPYDAEVEYLESTAKSGFYIDSGIGRPTTFESAEIQTKVQFTSTAGRQIAGSTNDFYFGVNANRWECNYNTYKGTADTNIHDYSKRLSVTSNRLYLNVYLDGNSIWSNNISYSATQWGNNIGIFNYSVSSTAGWQAKIYKVKIYVNDVLVRDYIPVRVGTTGYLYDIVSGTLFGNSGSGSFTLGNDV
ncbi:MAG: hypothetical protein J5510_08315 [Prevotella sp.]|nr:hypothetical protein [Prevotella sp.]